MLHLIASTAFESKPANSPYPHLNHMHISTTIFTIAVLSSSICCATPNLPQQGLLLDLNAAKGVTLTDNGTVSKWENQAPTNKAKNFVPQDKGRTVAGSGQPEFNAGSPHSYPSLIFRQQELVNSDEDTFDGLTTGFGHTWICIVKPYQQRVGLKDVNSFFGNLRNGAKYEGLWGNFKDDNTLWAGSRNGITFGRFDENNPLMLGNKLEPNKFYLVASRMEAGTGTVKAELFLDSAKPIATSDFPVNPDANPSKMAIGQERDAIEHPGKESFDGEIARLLIYQRALSDKELGDTLSTLKKHYAIK